VATVPDFLNLTAREVLQRSNGQDMHIQLRGQGVVVEMDPPAGSPLPADKHVSVILR
jgi:hypothetical protein